MGAGQGSALRLIDDEIELLRETRDFARWTLGDVVELHKRFQKTHGMAITESQFENLLLLKASDIVGSKEIFSVLDTNRDGRIDGLEFLAALVCVSRASFEDKARFAFELFDFNLNGSLSLTELALLMKSVWVGMSLLTGHQIQATPAVLTSVSKFLQLAQLAFERFDRDNGASLQYEEFVEWARSNREFMLQVEQFRVISEKAVGFEESLSLPDGSDNDSDLEDEASVLVPPENTRSGKRIMEDDDEVRRPELSTAPWIIEPTKAHASSRAAATYDFPPPIHVSLEWIYGYSGATSRNTVRVLTNGDVVYAVSKYAIVYNADRHEQRHYFGHKYPITCLDVNATATIVASGDAVPQQHQHSEIHVWNGLTLECLAVLSSFHVDSIVCLAFPVPEGVQTSTPLTTGGMTGKNATLAGAVASAKKQHHAADSLLVSVGSDANASMALWDWQNARLLASGRAINKRKRVLCVAVCEDGHEILIAGEHFLVFHHVDGRFFKMKKPKSLETKMQTMPICVSATYHGAHVAVVGTAKGELLQFHHMQLVRVVQAHDIGQSINVCTLSCRSMVLFTASKDGILKQWDSTLQPIGHAIDLHQNSHVHGLEHEDFRVHSLAYDAVRQRFVVGTRQGHLLEILEAHSTARVLASSHRGAEIDGLATSRFGSIFVTCSSRDRMMRVWNIRRRVEEHAIKLSFSPSACVFSTANGRDLLAVGGHDGSIALFRAKSLLLLSQMKNTQTAVTCLRFHPSELCTLLAVACANGLIYLYSIDDSDGTYRFHRFALLKPLPGEPASVVCSLDFSVGGKYLKSQHGRVVSNSTEGTSATLRFWQVRTSLQSVSRIRTLSTIRDVQWHSYSSDIGWHVGAFSGTSISALSANAASSVVATLDNRGRLQFRHFPCVSGSSDSKRSLAITIANAHLHGPGAKAALGFALHDTLLLSTSSWQNGTASGSVVIQWAIAKEEIDPQPRLTSSVIGDYLYSTISALGLENLYFHDDSYVPRRNGASIDAVFPPTSASDLAAHAEVRNCSQAPDLDLSLARVCGMNYSHNGVNQILVGMNGPTGSSSALVYGAGTLIVSAIITATQVKQQHTIISGLKHDISSIVKQSNSVVAVGSHRENRVLLWQWEPTPQLLGVLRGPSSSTHVLTAFDSGDYGNASAKDIAAAVWYSPGTSSHVLRFYHWRNVRDNHDSASDNETSIQADMTRLPVLFGFFTPSLQNVPAQRTNTVGFVSGGVDHVSFWWFTISTGHVVNQQGVFGRHALVETATCGTYAAPYVLTGMLSGVIIVWDNGVAAFSLPALEGAPSGEKKDCAHAVMSIVAVASKQLVVVALRSGHIVTFLNSKEADPARYRANAFLQRVHVVALFDQACAWMMLNPVMKPNVAADSHTDIATQMRQSLTSDSILQSVTVLDELQSGFAVVLSTGVVLHVDGHTLSTPTTKATARVVLDFGHHVAAIALHPLEQWMALGNADGRVRVMHLETQAVLSETRALSAPLKAIAWQNDANARLAVSLSNGNIAILNSTNLVVDAEFPCGPSTSKDDKAPKKWCWVLKFSSYESATTWLAAACRDYHIYVYKCASGDTMTCELAHDFAGHTAPISSLDITWDGRWLQSATSSLDSQFIRWQLSEPGESAKSPSDPAAWATWTVPFSGPVAGLSEVHGSEVMVVDRIQGEKPTTSGLWNSRLPTILIGTEVGRVLLGWFPLRCGKGKYAMFKEYDGYFDTAAPVERAAFSANNAFAVTHATNPSGSSDIVLIWKTDYDEELRLLERVGPKFGDAVEVATQEQDNIEANEPTAAKLLLDKDDRTRTMEMTRGAGDEFMAVKPWLGAIREPSVVPPDVATNSSLPPTADLALEFVYGVNANATNTHNDVFYADDSWEIVYSAASFGVVYNTKTRTQLLNATHSGQMVSCVAVHPGRGDLVVTGEIAGGKKTPRLVAWDANSGSTITQIDSVHTRGIALLAFAPSGERVASIGMDDDHVLAVYALRQSHGLATFKLLAQMKTSKQPVLTLAFHHELDSELVTAGLKHILFWSTTSDATSNVSALGPQRRRGSGAGSSTKGTSTADAPVTLSMKKGLFGRDGGASAKVLAAVYVPRSQQQAHVVTGQHDGSLCVWKARQCVDVKQQAHKGAIYALVVDAKAPYTVYSGGHDGRINLWSAQLEQLTTLELGKLFTPAPGSPQLFNTIVKSLAVRDARILFSTDGGDVGELVGEDVRAQSTTTSATYKPHLHFQSHCKGELWGLATHPTKLQFVTAGDDGSVRMWDAPTRSILAMYQAKTTSRQWRAVAFSSDGSHVVAGSADGHMLVLNDALDTTIQSWRCSPKAIAVVAFGPENRLLAVGTHDQHIYVYDGHTYKPIGVCRGHSATVTHLDFSTDGRLLQSTSAAGELLFWDVSTSTIKQVPSATAVRDTSWATWTLPFGWPVQGIWPPGSDGSDINAVARSSGRRVVATADDNGVVMLFRFPCVASQAAYKAFSGHASHATNCRFTRDDYYLLTTGGLDNTVCQYKYYNAS